MDPWKRHIEDARAVCSQFESLRGGFTAVFMFCSFVIFFVRFCGNVVLVYSPYSVLLLFCVALLENSLCNKLGHILWRVYDYIQTVHTQIQDFFYYLKSH